MDNRRTFLQKIFGVAALATASGWAEAFVHPLDEPALSNQRLVGRTPLLAVSSAGRRLVAVGLLGQIALSDDGGNTWTQARVPVSSDLVAVTFATEKLGWAVGHGGVVLHSADAGNTWVKQLDGRQAGKIAAEYLEKRASEGPAMAQLLADEKLLLDTGGTQPFLDVYFENEQVGYVVGTFNRLFRTDNGGKSWAPWMDRTDNPNGLHFNAIAGTGQSVYLTGEQGTVWRLDNASKRFVALATSYKGTLFGLLLLSPSLLLAYGMRGSVFRSSDAGASWEKITMSSLAGVTDGAVLPDGTVALVTQAGFVEISRDQGRTFVPVKPAQPMPYFGVTPLADGRLVLVGAEGARVEAMRK